jgi:endonuclease I
LPTPRRRLTAALCAVSLGWALLVLGVAAPAQAEAVAPAAADAGGRDAPHDPATYYAGTEGLSGSALALQLNSIIDGHTFIPYTSGSTDVWDALDVLDQDPNDPTKVIDVYSGDSLGLTNKCGSSCPNADSWNREHTWSQSRGSFDTGDVPGTDLFHMRVSRGNTNSSRGNLDFDETVGGSVPGCPSVCTRDSDSFEPRENIKGDIARGLFYMDVRYNGDADDGYGLNLRMWDQVGDSGSQIGKLSTLVAWSLADPPDDRERWRNDKIDGDYQHNRNPFIDHPEWVEAIW